MTSTEGNASVPKGVVNVALILFVWSLLTCFVRGWVKRRAWAPDDTVISVALLIMLGHVIAITKASGYGFPLPWSELDTQDREKASKTLYVAQLFYVLALGGIKIASGIFNTRLTLDPGNALIATCLTAGCGIWTVVSLLIIAIRGKVAEPWLTYNGSYTMYLRWMGVEIVGNLLDLTMWALSTYFVARLNMKSSRKVYLSAIFGCRLIIIPFTVLRLISLSPSRNLNHDAPPVAANIYGELAVNGAFIAASITCLKPFLRPFDMGYTHTSRANDISGGVKNSRGDTYYMLSATRSTNNDKNYSVMASRLSQRDTERSISAPTPTFRPAGHKSRATIESHEYVPDNRRAPHPPMTISMTKEWDVKYEEDKSIPNETK